MLHPTTAPKKTVPISVLLVDDDPDFRSGLCTFLNFYSAEDNSLRGHQTLRVVGQAASVDQAIALAKQQKPTLILLDLELGESNGIQFLTQYDQLKQHGKVLMLSDYAEDESVYRAMQAGARGFLLKQNLSTQLCQAIVTLLQEKIYLPAEAASGFFRQFHFYNGKSLKTSSTIHFTPRQLDVLGCLTQGDSNATIAKKLIITEGTAKFYVREITEKLGVENRTQVAIAALKMGLV
ncbi:MAG: response regulator transcription factor [Cyanobacteria bacterium J06560_6]